MRLKERFKVLKGVFERVEKTLDEINGDMGSLCMFCGTLRYNGKVGIVHRKGCIILEIRKEIKKLTEEIGQFIE